jgi:hypothetical protein
VSADFVEFPAGPKTEFVGATAKDNEDKSKEIEKRSNSAKQRNSNDRSTIQVSDVSSRNQLKQASTRSRQFGRLAAIHTLGSTL